jgi:hypothetical protein
MIARGFSRAGAIKFSSEAIRQQVPENRRRQLHNRDNGLKSVPA